MYDVRVPDGREPVSYDDRRPALHHPVQRLLDDPLALRVQRRRGLVQQEYSRVPHQRPGDRDPLLLSAGKLTASVADVRLVTLNHDQTRLSGRQHGFPRDRDTIAQHMLLQARTSQARRKKMSSKKKIKVFGFVLSRYF